MSGLDLHGSSEDHPVRTPEENEDKKDAAFIDAYVPQPSYQQGTTRAPTPTYIDVAEFRRVIGEAFADFDIGGWWKCVPGPERRQLADAVIAACDAYRAKRPGSAT